MMRRIRKLLTGIFLLSFVTQPALADRGLTTEEMAFAFGAGYNPVELGDITVLSDEEMRAVKGEFLRFIIPYLKRAFTYISRIRVNIKLDGPHHNFEKTIWGKIDFFEGPAPHLQMNVWIKGKKGSGKPLFRIPIGPAVEDGKQKIKKGRKRVTQIRDVSWSRDSDIGGRTRDRLNWIARGIEDYTKDLERYVSRMEAARNEMLASTASPASEEEKGNWEIVLSTPINDRDLPDGLSYLIGSAGGEDYAASALRERSALDVAYVIYDSETPPEGDTTSMDTGPVTLSERDERRLRRTTEDSLYNYVKHAEFQIWYMRFAEQYDHILPPLTQ